MQISIGTGHASTASIAVRAGRTDIAVALPVLPALPAIRTGIPVPIEIQSL